MTARLLALAAVPMVLLAGPLAAQSQPTRYLPLDSWTTPYVEHLVRAGVLRGLDPLTRPFRRADVMRALADVDESSLGDGARSLVTLLSQELADPGEAEAKLVVEGEAGFLAASDPGRWESRPQAGAARAYPQGRLAAALELPHVALVTTPTIDNRLKFDSLYTGKQDRVIAGRNTASYVTASWRYADVTFGNIERNWGPSELDGLLVSPAPYSREQLMLRLGPPRLRLEMLVQQLNPLVPWDSTSPRQRWLVAHRIVIQPSDRLTFSLDESSIATGEGLPWRYLNPLTSGVLTQYDGGQAPNNLLGAAFSWQLRPTARIYGQLLLDDIQVDKNGQADNEPPSYGFTVGGSGSALNGGATWTAWYTRVTNLTYRTPEREEQYSSDSIGIGRNHADYDEAMLRITTTPAPRLLIGGELSTRRQGEGDLRTRYPTVAQYADSLTFLTGVVERTVTLGARADWTRGPLAISAYAGYNAISNSGHQPGVSQSRWVWRIRVLAHGRLARPIN